MRRNTLTDTAPTTVETNELPRWDLSALFPSLDSPEFAEGFDRLWWRRSIDPPLRGSRNHGDVNDPLRNRACSRFRTRPERLNDVSQQLESWDRICTGASLPIPQRAGRPIQLQERAVALEQAETRFTAWVGTLPIERPRSSTPSAEHEFPLRQLHVAARISE